MKIGGVTYIRNKRRSRRIKIQSILILIFIIAVAASILFSSKVSWVLMHPEKIIPQIQKSLFPTMSDVKFRDVTDSVELSGWYFKAPAPSDKTIILAHDYTSNRMIFGDFTTTFIQAALEKNYNLLTFDFRGHGNSGGNSTTLGLYEKNDLLGAVNYAKSSGSKHVILLGLSMGGAASILALASDPSAADAVISDSSFAELKTFLYENLSSWSNLPKFPFSYLIIPISSVITGLDPEEVSPVKSIEKIPSDKIMLIHSESDNTIPYAASLKLFQASDSTSVFWVIKNAPHNKIFESHTKDYIDKVFTFADKCVARAALQNSQILPPPQPKPSQPALLPVPTPEPDPKAIDEFTEPTPTSTPGAETVTSKASIDVPPSDLPVPKTPEPSNGNTDPNDQQQSENSMPTASPKKKSSVHKTPNSIGPKPDITPTSSTDRVSPPTPPSDGISPSTD